MEQGEGLCLHRWRNFFLPSPFYGLTKYSCSILYWRRTFPFHSSWTSPTELNVNIFLLFFIDLPNSQDFTTVLRVHHLLSCSSRNYPGLPQLSWVWSTPINSSRTYPELPQLSWVWPAPINSSRTYPELPQLSWVWTAPINSSRTYPELPQLSWVWISLSCSSWASQGSTPCSALNCSTFELSQTYFVF